VFYGVAKFKGLEVSAELMSLLRQIMHTLARRRQPGRALQGAAADPPSPETLDYRAAVAAAADAALLYEWEWLEQRLAALAPSASVERQQLLAWRSLLTTECQRRSLSPIKPPAAVDPERHAWELTDAALRRAWRLP
jgi:hypothetical protein